MRNMWLERWIQRRFDNLGPWLRRRKQAMADWLDYQPLPLHADDSPHTPRRSRDGEDGLLIPGATIPELARLNEPDDAWPGAIAPGQHPWTVRLPDISPEEEAAARAVAERVIDDLHREAAAEQVARRRRSTEGGVA